MASQLLPAGTGASTTGPWVSAVTGGKRAFPARVVILGNFVGDGVFIETLNGGLPNSKLANGVVGPFPPGANDTGVVDELGVIPEGGGDLAIHEPFEFIRARTGAFTGGTVSVAGIEFSA